MPHAASTNLGDNRLPLVLIVDDCQAVHRLLSARLRAESVRIESAMDGAEAVEIAETLQPDLVLLDLDMPGMDGFEVLRAMKSSSTTHDIPVIILSGKAASQDKVAAFDLGAVDFVAKPFEMAELRARIRVALRMQSLVRMLAQRAHIDGLTGLYNRAYFQTRWKEEVERAARARSPLSLAMIDLDEFKSINDSYGHPAGDAVLQGVSQLLAQSVRLSDVACRYGGEEFALILPETTPSEAGGLCERIRARCESISWSGHPGRRVTMSVGIAGATDPSLTGLAHWIEAADQRLYDAKRAGRNRVLVTDLDDGAESGPLRVAS